MLIKLLKKSPLTLTIIACCIMVFLWMQLDAVRAERLFFISYVPYIRFVEINQGEYWRLITPIFLHFGSLHLLMNLMLFAQLGSLIEYRYQLWVIPGCLM